MSQENATFEEFDYRDSELRVSDGFKRMYMKPIGKGQNQTEAISAAGLTAYCHHKGIKSLTVDVIQLPTVENNNMCICQATLVGYGWSPIEEKIIEVTYSEIGDASPANCGKLVGPHFVRMASTRAIARVQRKYTNMDLLCQEETDMQVSQSQTQLPDIISNTQLVNIKTLLRMTNSSSDYFQNLLIAMFGHSNYNNLTRDQGDALIASLIADMSKANNAPAASGQT